MTLQDAFYLPLLAMSGCTAESHVSASMLGDEVLIGTESYGPRLGRSARDVARHAAALCAAGRSLGGLAAIVRAFGRMSSAAEVCRRTAKRRRISRNGSTRHSARRFRFRRSIWMAPASRSLSKVKPSRWACVSRLWPLTPTPDTPLAAEGALRTRASNFARGLRRSRSRRALQPAQSPDFAPRRRAVAVGHGARRRARAVAPG